MDAFLYSTLAVAIAEIGDKTQLLTLLLAARYRRPWTLALAILVATLANHALAGLAGALLAGLLPADWLRLLLALSFLVVAAWTLIPDRLDADQARPRVAAGSAFLACTLLFFFVEIGDKTQVATLVLAAKFDALLAVVLGTTLGMLLANLPVIWLGDRFASRLPLQLIRAAAAAVFVLLAVLVAVGGG